MYRSDICLNFSLIKSSFRFYGPLGIAAEDTPTIIPITLITVDTTIPIVTVDTTGITAAEHQRGSTCAAVEI